MDDYKDIHELPKKPRCVAIGNFDGCHLGHRKIITNMLEVAKEKNLTPTVLTFNPHPISVVNESIKVKLLTTIAERLKLLEGLGVQTTLVQNFTKKIASLSPEEFFESFIINAMQANSLHVGYNFFFGKNRSGNTATLEELCKKHNVLLNVTQAFEQNDLVISSSKVRSLIQSGDVKNAMQFLGDCFFMIGKVIHGQGLGGKIGFKTANIDYEPNKILPKNGVYVTRSTINEKTYWSVTNVGIRPTVSESIEKAIVETHIFDFDSQVYNEAIKCEFLDRIRDEQKFDSVDALKDQIKKDSNYAKQWVIQNYGK